MLIERASCVLLLLLCAEYGGLGLAAGSGVQPVRGGSSPCAAAASGLMANEVSRPSRLRDLVVLWW